MSEVNSKYKDYIKELIALERDRTEVLWKAHDKEHALLNTALVKAEQTLNARLETMNEFRAQLNAQQQNFALKSELRPFQSFVDKFTGTFIAFSIANIILTSIVSIIIRLWK